MIPADFIKENVRQTDLVPHLSSPESLNGCNASGIACLRILDTEIKYRKPQR